MSHQGVPVITQLRVQMEQDSTSKVGLGIIERKAALAARSQELHALMRDSQLATFRTEARNRCAFTCINIPAAADIHGTVGQPYEAQRSSGS